jgi:glyoxylase-like metal-dependent hydrolase (beta-lactamase superfamily II)
MMTTRLLPLIVAAMFSQASPQPGGPSPAPPVEMAPGIHLIRGAVVPERGPDGNTILIEAPDGLIVVDTGRHTYHSDAILAFARDRTRPIAAIVNTHWHLDHASGNGRLKAAFPKARVYTTTAVDRAIGPGGFLTRNLVDAQGRLTSGALTGLPREEAEIFVRTMDERALLRADVPVTGSGRQRIAGRPLDLRVTDGAVTDADLWLYDEATRVVILGDLVTVPVPYFETACPDRWRQAMDTVWATPFTTAVPGHGPPLTRGEFDAYRTALGQFIDCARSDAAPAECGTRWTTAAAGLIGDDPERRRAVGSGIEYYVGYLRKNGGKSPDCLAR